MSVQCKKCGYSMSLLELFAHFQVALIKVFGPLLVPLIMTAIKEYFFSTAKRGPVDKLAAVWASGFEVVCIECNEIGQWTAKLSITITEKESENLF